MHTFGGDIEACDIFLIGGVAMCDSLWQRGGRGSNVVEKSVTYFLNGPKGQQQDGIVMLPRSHLTCWSVGKNGPDND